MYAQDRSTPIAEPTTRKLAVVPIGQENSDKRDKRVSWLQQRVLQPLLHAMGAASACCSRKEPGRFAREIGGEPQTLSQTNKEGEQVSVCSVRSVRSVRESAPNDSPTLSRVDQSCFSVRPGQPADLLPR